MCFVSQQRYGEVPYCLFWNEHIECEGCALEKQHRNGFLVTNNIEIDF